MQEEWRDIRGYEGRYQISSLGNIRSLPRVQYQLSRHPGVMMNKRYAGRRLTPTDNGNGYLIIGLCDGAKRKNHYVHRLVAEAFLPNPDCLPEINHIDYDKTNNSAANLEWSDRVANVRWSRGNMQKPTPNAKKTNLGMRYISKRDGKYRFSIHIKRLGYQVDKKFETLDEAIAAREAFINGKEYFAAV